MKFNFPSDKVNESNVATSYGHSNEVGCFPIGRQFNWHGGIHIEGKGQPIRAIADGIVVAYRVPDYCIGYDGINGQFSNSFVLVQHKYTSPQGRDMIYYSLYMHLYSKFSMEYGDGNVPQIPSIFEDLTYNVLNKEPMHYENLRGRLEEVTLTWIGTADKGAKLELGQKTCSKNKVKYREVLSIEGTYNINKKKIDQGGTMYVYESGIQFNPDGTAEMKKRANIRTNTIKTQVIGYVRNGTKIKLGTDVITYKKSNFTEVSSIEGAGNYKIEKTGFTINAANKDNAVYIYTSSARDSNEGKIVKSKEDGKGKTPETGINIYSGEKPDKGGANWLGYLEEETEIELASAKKKLAEYEEVVKIGTKTIAELYGEGTKCYISGENVKVTATCNIPDEQLATKDDPKVITGDNCCIPVKAGDIIGYADDCDYLSGIYYKAAHVEVFSFDDPAEFIKGITGDGENKKDDTENTKYYVKIPQGTDFTIKYPSPVKLEKEDVVVIEKQDGGYMQLKKTNDKNALTYWVKEDQVKTTENIKITLTKTVMAYKGIVDAMFSWFPSDQAFQEGDRLELTEDGAYYKVEKATMQREALKTDFQETGDCGCSPKCTNPHYCKRINKYYPPKEDKFLEINEKFNGLLEKTTMLTYVKKSPNNTNEKPWRIVTFTAEDTGLYIKKEDVKDQQEKKVHTLTDPITELYCMNPKGKSDGSTGQELILKHTELPVLTIGKENYYLNEKNTNGLPFGLTVKQTDQFEKISPHNWEAFGFAIQNKEPYNFYYSKDNCQGSPFLKDAYGIMDGHMLTEKGKIKKDPDNPANGEISKEELLMGIKSAGVQKKLSRMICYHTSEWAVDYSSLENEVSALLDETIKNYSGKEKKQLKDDKPRILKLLEDKLKALDFWGQVEVGQQSIDKQLGRESKPKEREKSDIKPIKRTLESFSMVYGENGAPDRMVANYKQEHPDPQVPQPQKPEPTPEEKKKEQEEKALEEKLKFKPDQKEVWHFHPVAFVEQMRMMHPSSNDEECPSLVWGVKVNCEFRKRVVQISKRLECDPNHLMAAMALETGGSFSPKIENSLGYVGLIQFGAKAITQINKDYFRHKAKITKQYLKSLSAEDQLYYVEYYLGRFKGRLKTLADFYLAILMPIDVGKGEQKDHVVFDSSLPLNYKSNGEVNKDDITWIRKNGYKANPGFHSEDDEVTKNSKGVIYKKQGKVDGKTYVWEIANAIQSWYDKGDNQKNNLSACDCKNLQVDLSNKVVWMTQFNKGEIKKGKMQTDGCWRTSEKLLLNTGLKKGSGSKTGMIITALEDDAHTKLTLTNSAKAGVEYIDSELNKGNPVIVGLDHTLNYTRGGGKAINADEDLGDPGTTDHYVVIVGRGFEDNKTYYRFYEVGTSYPEKGQHPDNKLFLGDDFSLKGSPAYSTSKKYTVTQVRKNKQ